ncbi:MAG: PorT family protein [Spirochaetota bacterium]|nr:MAG: PorT family protein [Spirochaetota bacterium]
MKRGVLLLVLFVIFLLTSTSLLAVDFSFGIKGGVNAAMLNEEPDLPYQNTFNVGFSAGVFGSVLLADWFSIDPSILFTLKGNTAGFAFNKPTPDFDYVEGNEIIRLGYFEIPVLFKFYPSFDMYPDMYHRTLLPPDVRINLFIGPYVGILSFVNYHASDDVRIYIRESLGYEPGGDFEDFKTLDYGMVFGVGIDYRQFLAEFSISIAFKTVDTIDIQRTRSNLVITLMVGYRILGGYYDI